MTQRFTRRSALKAAAAGLALPWSAATRAALADDEIESHGLSSFGDLALPPDFKHFDYVNPDAPKGGLLSLQITATGGNQNFDTFDTLNMFSKKGDGAAGMTATFDKLMTAAATSPIPSMAWSPARSATPRTSSPTASCCAPRRVSTTARN